MAKHDWKQVFEIIQQIGATYSDWGALARAVAARTGSMPRTTLMTGIERELARTFATPSELAAYLSGNDEEAMSPLANAILALVQGSGRDTVFSVHGLSERFDRSGSSILSAADELRQADYYVNVTGESIVMPKMITPSYDSIPVEVWTQPASIHRFGLVSDTHLGNRCARLDVVNALYDIFQSEGIETVLHGGNLVDGECRFNTAELVAHGVEGQIAYAAEHYPQRDGITTRFLSADDHEGWWAQRIGFDIGRHMDNQFHKHGRDDLRWLGHMEVDLQLSKNNPRSVLRIMHPGGGSSYATCFDDTTEILTQSRGWVLFADLQPDDSVATLNPETEELEYQCPTAYTDEPYSGEMVNLANRSMNLLVTPNHRMWVRRPWHKWPSNKGTGKQSNQEYQFVEAKDIKGRDWVLPRTAKWAGHHIDEIKLPAVAPLEHGRLKYNFSSLPARSFLRLLGWYVAEGNLNHTNRQIEIAQNPGAKQDEIAALVEALGYKPYVWGAKVRITSRQLYEYVKGLGLGTAREKFVPAFIKNLTPELIWEFLEGYLRGDGCKAPRGKSKSVKWHSMTTASRRLADDLQELLVKVGLSGTIRHRTQTEHFIGDSRVKASDNFVVSINYAWREAALPTPSRVSYSGRIYCVSVPNQIILVRRGGRAVFTGNSYQVQKFSESWQGGNKPSLALYGHYHKAGYFYPREVHSFLMGTTEDQTMWMRKKKLAAHVGGWIIEVHITEMGGVGRVKGEFFPFYDQNYYQDWNYASMWE